jgi:hypothetical protein
MIRFIIPNDYNQYLAIILNNIRVEDYYWLINESEIYLPVENGVIKPLFHEKMLSGIEFLNSILLPKYYIISANMQAYCDINHINMDIKRLPKDCEITVTIVDSQYAEVSSPNIDIETIIENNIKSQFQRVNKWGKSNNNELHM